MEPEGSGPSYLYHDGVRTRNFLTFVNAVTLLHATQDPGAPADALPAYKWQLCLQTSECHEYYATERTSEGSTAPAVVEQSPMAHEHQGSPFFPARGNNRIFI